jgi:hypothetical protein
MKTRKDYRVAARIPEALYLLIVSRAQSMQRTVADYVRLALVAFVKRSK